MPVQKIKSGRIITVQANTYVGDKGVIFYDEDTPELRLSDGITPGGILFTSGSGGTGTYVLVTATNTRLGGIKVGPGLSISADGTLSATTATSGVSDSFKTIKVNSQTDLVAVGADTIEFKAGNGILIETSTTSSPYQSLTITSTGIGNIDGGMFDTVFDTTTLIVDGGTP
jgi:hypothetical protein